MHQSTTPSLSQTIWPRWASKQFLSLPIVQTLLPVTFSYSLSSEVVVMRQLRRWKRLGQGHWHAHTRGLPWGLLEVVGTIEQVHCSRRRLLRYQIPEVTCPELVTTFLHQQIPVLNQRPSSCINRNQSCTSDHLSNDYQSCTSYPDLHQRLDPAPTITIRPRRLFTVRFSDFRFAIISLAYRSNILVLLFLPSSLSITYISKSLQGPVYLSASTTDFNNKIQVDDVI